VTIPAGVIIGENTYEVTSIGERDFGFFAGSSARLSWVAIADSVTTIGDSAFEQTALSALTLGKSVTTIGASAFAFNLLTTVTIPDSVTIPPSVVSPQQPP
jgi:hypothetical protein